MKNQPKPAKNDKPKKAFGESELRWMRSDTDETFITQYDFPFELFAQTAAQLLAGKELSSTDAFDYSQHSNAADEALKLLHACAIRLEKNKMNMNQLVTQGEKIKKLGANIVLTEFKKAISIITGQSRTDRAEEDYTSLLQAMHPKWTKAELSAAIENKRRSGFTGERILELKRVHDEARDRGYLGKKRRPQKIFLDKVKNGKSASNSNKTVSKQSKA